MNRGYTLAEFVVSLCILGILMTVGFMNYDFGVKVVAKTAKNLETQGNIRFATTFINNLLLDCNKPKVEILQDHDGSSKLLVDTTLVYLSNNKLNVRYNYPSPGPKNELAEYITGFDIVKKNGMLSIRLTAGSKRDKEPITIDMKVYTGD